MEDEIEELFKAYVQGIIKGEIDFDDKLFKEYIYVFEKVVLMLKKKKHRIARNYHSKNYDIYILSNSNRIMCCDIDRIKFKEISIREFNEICKTEEMKVVKFNALNENYTIDTIIEEREKLINTIKEMLDDAQKAYNARKLFELIKGSK